MKVKRLKEILKSTDDDLDVFIRNSVNVCGNIASLEQLEMSSYGFFGEDIPCLILNTDSSKELELNANEDIVDFLLGDNIVDNDNEDSFDNISTLGAIDYLTSFIEDMEEKISNGDKNKMLYEERILFINKAVEICNESLKK